MTSEDERFDLVEYAIEPSKSSSDFDELDDLSCVVCGEVDVEVVFEHDQRPNRRVAIAQRSGLCSACVELIKSAQFESAADRGGVHWDDFERSDLLDTLQDIEASISSYRPSLGRPTLPHS